MSETLAVLIGLMRFPEEDYRGPCWCPELMVSRITEGSRSGRRPKHSKQCDRAQRLFESLVGTEPSEGE